MSNSDKLLNTDPDEMLAQLHGKMLEGKESHDLKDDRFYNLLNSAKTSMESKENSINVEGADKVWESILASMNISNNASTNIRQLRTVWIGYAIAAVLVLSIATLLWYQISDTSSDNLIAQTTDTIRTVTLIDGTAITLGPNSELSYIQNTDLQVTVSLKGEAYFDVRSNPYRVFTVQTSNSRVVVIGTRFNLQSYDNTSTVHLIEGEVTFEGSSPATAISLVPGQASKVGSEGVPSTPFEFDMNEVVSWAEIQIILDGRTVGSVLDQISNRFDVDIRVPENLLNEQLGGTLYIGSLNQTVQDLGLVLGGNFKRDEHGNYDFVKDP